MSSSTCHGFAMRSWVLAVCVIAISGCVEVTVGPFDRRFDVGPDAVADTGEPDRGSARDAAGRDEGAAADADPVDRGLISDDGVPDRGLAPDADACMPGVEACDSTECDGDPMGGPPCNGCPAGTVVPMGWVCIPPGRDRIGTPADEDGYDGTHLEGPPFWVEIRRPYLMKATEETRGEWAEIFDFQPPATCPAFPGQSDEHPQACILWFEAALYANRRSTMDGLDACYVLHGCDGVPPGAGTRCETTTVFVEDCNGYRLPTEAQWEYAARAGTNERFSTGSDDAASLVPVAWCMPQDCGEEPNSSAQPVGQKESNPWGLHDMHGNVHEWVEDVWAAYPTAANMPDALCDYAHLNPPAAVGLEAPCDEGSARAHVDIARVIRGGAYDNPANLLRSGARLGRSLCLPRHHWIGFRLARAVPGDAMPVDPCMP